MGIQILVMDKEGEKELKENLDNFRKHFMGLPLNNIQIRIPNTWGGVFYGTEKYQYAELGSTYSPCSYIWSSVFFLWDGTAVACCADFWGLNKLGKFPEESIREIWNSDRYRNFRQAMLERDYNKYSKYCEKCDSLWSDRILGLPPGIRGVAASAVSYCFGYSMLKVFKKIAARLNPNFTMKLIE